MGQFLILTREWYGIQFLKERPHSGGQTLAPEKNSFSPGFLEIKPDPQTPTHLPSTEQWFQPQSGLPWSLYQFFPLAIHHLEKAIQRWSNVDFLLPGLAAGPAQKNAQGRSCIDTFTPHNPNSGPLPPMGKTGQLFIPKHSRIHIFPLMIEVGTMEAPIIQKTARWGGAIIQVWTKPHQGIAGNMPWKPKVQIFGERGSKVFQIQGRQQLREVVANKKPGFLNPGLLSRMKVSHRCLI